MRVGFGYDIHALVNDRALVLGGVTIPFDRGLEGHSDADVLCHAIMDAVLGATALGDIGQLFPDTDPQYKNVSSIELLARVHELIKRNGYEIVNLDSTVVAEKPRLLPYRENIIDTISNCLQLEKKQISVKATTHEGFDATGRKEAISAFAVATIRELS